jgi:hypothetical protein
MWAEKNPTILHGAGGRELRRGQNAGYCSKALSGKSEKSVGISDQVSRFVKKPRGEIFLQLVGSCIR